MLSINKRKYLKSLNNKKHRLIEKKVLIEGLRIIDEGISSGLNFEHIWISNRHDKYSVIYLNLIKKIKTCDIPYTFEIDKDIQFISNTKNSQGIVALLIVDNLFNENLHFFSDKIVILDRISDPGNLGTIIRTCAWFGITSLILTKSSADIFNPKCLRSSMGGHFYIDNCIYLSNKKIVDFISLHKYKIYCSSMEGKSIYNLERNDKWALILGSEAHGINEELLVGEKITIPKKGSIESLNVSIASGIMLDYLTRG